MSADRVIVALDVPSQQEVDNALDLLLPEVRFLKVGMELFYGVGLDLIRKLKDLGLKVFLDLKIHDIPNTAERAARNLSRLGCDILNVHCAGGLEMMQAARQGAGSETTLIGVTQLTSIDQQTLNNQLRIEGSLEDCVVSYAELAQQAGLSGVVCSPHEVTQIKAKLGSHFLTVTPGVRLQGSNTQDQKRVMTPAEAVSRGADYLVMGRPILASPNPKESFRAIVTEMEAVQ